MKIWFAFSCLLVISDLPSPAISFSLNPEPIKNGKLECSGGFCTVICDYGFISAAQKFFPIEDTLMTERASCEDIMAIMIGGSNNDVNLSSVEIFSTDPSLQAIEIRGFPYPVEYPVVLWVSGQVLACGGFNTETLDYENRCWTYDPCQNEWIPSLEMTLKRGEAVGVVTDDDLPWVLGGKTTPDETTTTTTEMWNRTVEGDLFWSPGPSLEEEKAGHCAASSENGRTAVITGGVHSYNTVEEFDLDSGAHIYESDLKHKRHGHACGTYLTTFSVEATMVAGGYTERNIPLDTSELWSPLDRMWIEKEQLPYPRGGANMVTLKGKPTIIGGRSVNNLIFDNGLEYDKAADVWSEVPATLKEPRSFAGAAAVPVTLFDYCNQ